MSELESGDAKGIFNYVVSPELNNYTSYIFEDICKSYLRLKNRKEELPFYFSKIGRWWNKTDELDIMAVDYSKKKYILGECKYKNSPFSMSDLENMKKKYSPTKTDSEVFYWIFSKSGFTDEVKERQEETKLYLIELNEIVEMA